MLKKVLKSLKTNGLLYTLKRIISFVRMKFFIKNSKKERNILSSTIDLNLFDTIIIFENNFGWKKIMKQRPQQIAENLPSNTLMFYHTHTDSDFTKKERIEKIKDNLILIDLGYHRDALLDFLAEKNNKYLMVYSTDYIPLDRIKMYEDYNYSLLYEYVDDLNKDLCGNDLYSQLLNRHNNILKGEPIIICTATKLYNNITNDYKTLITNGVDYKHFKYNNYDIPEDLKPIKTKYKNLLCYYGALASWFDYNLVHEVAKDKNLGIVLIGQDYDKTLGKSNLLKDDNVYYLGRKEYDELPKYGCNCDIFIIPFIINDITESTSPVKLFEYMAQEKPIVTTALPECSKYKSVLYSKDNKDFINNIYNAIELKDNPEHKNLLVSEAQSNTWDKKASEMIQFANKSRMEILEKNISHIFTDSNYDRIIVWRSPFGWNVPLFQRPQHISNSLSDKKCLVLYEVTNRTDIVPTIKKQKDNLYLINFENYFVNIILNKLLKKINVPKYLQIYSTNWMMSLDELTEYKNNGFKILYEYIDDISPNLSGTDSIPQYISDKYDYAIKNDDVLIVTTANQLYNDVCTKRGTKNLVFSCNGVNYSFFQDINKNYKFEKNFLNVISNGKINICYYGALASWLDYPLLKRINETNEYNIILFGIKYDDSYDASNINKLENVHWFGPKNYDVLKNYASKMDILMIPFVINSITQATSPLKLFEYMALHKPIVTTAMNECKKYKSVLIANSHNEFLQMLKKATGLKNDLDYLELLDNEAKENDWNYKADLILKLIKSSE